MAGLRGRVLDRSPGLRADHRQNRRQAAAGAHRRRNGVPWPATAARTESGLATTRLASNFWSTVISADTTIGGGELWLAGQPPSSCAWRHFGQRPGSCREQGTRARPADAAREPAAPATAIISFPTLRGAGGPDAVRRQVIQAAAGSARTVELPRFRGLMCPGFPGAGLPDSGHATDPAGSKSVFDRGEHARRWVTAAPVPAQTDSACRRGGPVPGALAAAARGRASRVHQGPGAGRLSHQPRAGSPPGPWQHHHDRRAAPVAAI
jgi:hypothetical protein